MTPERIANLDLYAWVGEDELGSGEIGLKQGLTGNGTIPLVSVDQLKITWPYLVDQLAAQARQYGKTIRLCRFRFAEVVETIEPKGGG